MKIIFPYGVRFQEDGRLDVFPAAELSIVGRRGEGIRALFHIDSGATTSILPSSDAAVLGIRLLRGKKMIVRGIGDVLLGGYRHKVHFSFDNFRFKAPVIFIEHDSAPRILGREGIFTLFGIFFDEASGCVGFFERKSEKRFIGKALANTK